MRRCLLAGLLLLMSYCLHAQDEYQDSARELVDTIDTPGNVDLYVDPIGAPSLVDESVPFPLDSLDYYDDAMPNLVLRRVPDSLKAAFSKDKQLHYERAPKKQLPPREAPKWLMWIGLALMGLLKVIWALHWVIIAVILCGMLFLLYLFLKRSGYSFKRKENGVEGKELLAEEEPDVADYEHQLQAAIAEGKFRLAVRLMYLQTLRILADKELISYSREKTNAAYLRALSQTQYYKVFSTLTLDYEYIWYGEVPVNNDQFNVIQGQFRQFMNELGYSR